MRKIDPILDIINKKRRKPIDIFTLIIIALVFVLGLYAGRCSAAEFLISDFDFTNQNYTLNKIHKFIKKFPNNKLTDKQIYLINWQCRAWTINPLPVLATMEKETSIVTVPDNINSYKWREHRAMGYGLIHSVRSAGKKYYKYGFFDVQIHQGVRAFRRLFDQYQPYKKQYKLVTINEGLKKVLIKNRAHYALIRYTPYSKGSQDFMKIYSKFKKIWDRI